VRPLIGVTVHAQGHGRTVSTCSVLVDCLFGSEEYRRDPDKGLHSDSRDGRSLDALAADGHAFGTQQARSGGQTDEQDQRSGCTERIRPGNP
jgi:hypothetical protein